MTSPPPSPAGPTLPPDAGALLREAEALLGSDPFQAGELSVQAEALAPDDPETLTLARVIRAGSALRLGDAERALALLDLAAQTLHVGGTGPLLGAQYHLALGHVQHARGELGQAAHAFARAVQLAAVTDRPELQDEALNWLAQEQHRTLDSPAALATLDRLLSLRRALNDPVGEIKALCNKALILIARGDTPLALDTLLLALTRLERGDAPPQSELHVRSNLGKLMEQMGRLGEAETHFARGHEVALEIGDRLGEATMALNRGEIARKLGDSGRAEALLHNAQQQAETLGSLHVQGAALHSLGVLFSDLGEHVRASSYLDRAGEIARSSGDVDSEIEVGLGHGQNWLRQGESGRAMPALNRALALAQSGSRLQAALDAHLLLADAHEQRSPYDTITHLRAARGLETQLRDAELAQQARDLTAQAELDSARRQAEVERSARAQAEATIQRQVEELERGRLHDTLTGLPNRVLLRALLSRSLGETQNEEGQLALAVLDLDRFKTVNDSFGHGAGDELLRQVASSLTGRLRRGDVVARVGSDEFVTILHGVGEEGARERVRELLGAFSSTFTVAGQEVLIGASVGLAHYPGHGEGPDELLRAAHIALGDAKSGLGIASYDRDEGRQAALGLELALARALERGEFELYYQPLVDAGSGQPVTAEALLRWNHPTLGQRSPAEFIPVLESTGMIVQVGDWVLKEACRAAACWSGVRVAVNLSARQFAQGDVAGSVRAALAQSGLPGERLELEITESLMMQSSGQVSQLLGELRSCGVRVMLDDFGTGYSNLSYLDRFPLDGLKIDRSFVKRLTPTEDSGQALIKAIVQMSAAFGLEVVAEGVETREQHALLQRLGVPTLQGYLFGKPQGNWRPGP